MRQVLRSGQNEALVPVVGAERAPHRIRETDKSEVVRLSVRVISVVARWSVRTDSLALTLRESELISTLKARINSGLRQMGYVG